LIQSFSGLIRLKDILQIHSPEDSPITIRQLDGGPDYRPLFKEIQASGENHIILDVSVDKVMDILRQAQEVKMLEDYQRYILTSLDTHTLDFEELKFVPANITSVRLIDTKSFEVKTAVYDWEQGERNQNRVFRVSSEHVQVCQKGVFLCFRV
jgi:glutamate receptor, ionotropic, invertebrate